MRSITTAAPGTLINGGTFAVPAALGNKIIHPFSDFLLHDIGTGDGIVQNGGPSTANKLRTPPLWGCEPEAGTCTTAWRSRLPTPSCGMVERRSTTRAFRLLPAVQRRQIVASLGSL